MIEQVRRFNRAVTQRVGALDDAFLSRGRPLGQARVLWEIGPQGRDVKELRARLELDSGYLSRLLRSLEADGLVVVEPSDADARVRTARLTAAGQAEQAELDRLSRRGGRRLAAAAEHPAAGPADLGHGRGRTAAGRLGRPDRRELTRGTRTPARRSRPTSRSWAAGSTTGSTRPWASRPATRR